MATLFAGTSGYAYPVWKPGFYPDGLPAARFLEHYAGRLNSVEINYTFRHTPSSSTLASWAKATPPGFAFAIKAHQRITHVHRLKDAAEATEGFLKALDPLHTAGKLGPVLFQLPPYLKLDLDRLAAFLPLLPRDRRHAFEFRDPSWLTEDMYALLREHGVALCVAESERLEIPEVITADFVYFRLRKPDYTEDDVTDIATRARDILNAGRDLYVMFKHEDDPAGALNAEQLLRLVQGS